MTSETPAQPRSSSEIFLRHPLQWPALALLALAVLVVAAYFQPLPVALLVAVAAVVALAWVRPFWVFSGLLVLLPFHDQFIRIVTWQLGWAAGRVTMLSLWKEGVIALLFAVLAIQHLTGRRRIRAKAYHFDLWLLALLVLSAMYIVVAGSTDIGVFGFRNYFEPLAVFLLARLLPYSRQEMKRLLVLLALVAGVVAVYGIYQAEFYDFTTMIRLGYVDEFGNLPYAFKTALSDGQPRPRAISTVTGPNQLAIYLNLFILLVGYVLVKGRSPSSSPLTHSTYGSPTPAPARAPEHSAGVLGTGELRSPEADQNGGSGVLREGGRAGRKAVMLGLLAVYTVCLLLTYSRGGLMALLVSVMAAGLIVVYERGIRRTWHELIHNRWFLAGLVAVVILASSGIVVSGFARRVWRGVTGQDPAALGHLNSMDLAISFVAQNPLGVGMGMAGPRALRFKGAVAIQHTESTYLQFGMEIGLVGMALLLLVLLSLLATLWRMRQRRGRQGDRSGQLLTEVALVTWAGAMAVFTVTPLMQNFLVASYLWLVVGLAFHLDAYQEPAG